MRPEVQHPLTRSFGEPGPLQSTPAELNLGQMLILNQENQTLSTWAHAPREPAATAALCEMQISRVADDTRMGVAGQRAALSCRTAENDACRVSWASGPERQFGS